MRGDDGKPPEPEPIDLEPVDLEPVDPDSVRHSDRFDRERRPGGRPRWMWVVLAVCGLGVWAAIALATRHDHPSRATGTTTTTEAIPVARVDHIETAGPVLQAALARVGVEHFATVVDDRLYTFDSSRAEPILVPLAAGHVAISDQNGSSLLAWTAQQTLVSTRTVEIRPLPGRVAAIRANTPGVWWLVNSDGTMRRDRGDAVEPIPGGMHVIGAVDRGFIAYDDKGRWLLWSKTAKNPITRIAFPFPVDQFLVSSPRRVAFLDGCGYSGCTLYLYDVDQTRLARIQLSGVPAFATFSPDGTRLAIATNQGAVLVLDSADGQTLAQTTCVLPDSPAQPLSWTADGRALLVVQAGRIEIRAGADGARAGSIEGTDGVQQLIALP